MQEPGPHPEEAKRLRVLRELELLDTLPEEDFDDLAHAAAALVDVPICLVTLVDEQRQWFKSRVGLDVSETPRLISFCGHAILDPNLCPLVVEDATQDPRFFDNPMVVGDPRVIFYVGVPIVVQGMPIGTLCVIDHQPRNISSEKMKILMGLARQVQRSIDLRNRCRDQISNAVSLRTSAESAKSYLQNIIDNLPAMIGYWDLNLRNRFANKEYSNWFNLSPAEIHGRHIRDVIGSKLYQNNIPYIDGALRGIPQEFEREIAVGQNVIRHSLARYIPDIKDGKVLGFFVLVADVTAMRDAHALVISAKEAAEAAKIRLQTTLDAIPDLLFEVGEDGRLYDYHAHRAELLAAPPEMFIGKTMAEVLPSAASVICMAAIQEASEKSWSTGSVYSLALPQGETWFELSVSAMPATAASGRRFILLARDITARHRAEESQRVSENQLQTFISISPAALAMFDRQMCYLHATSQWMSDYRLDGRALIGRSHYDIFPEIDEGWKAIHRRGLAGEVVRAEEDRFVRGDGLVQWLRWEVRPWFDSTGVVGGIVIFSEDITARKVAMEELVFSEARFHHVIDASIVPKALNDEKLNIIFLNRAFSQTFGYDRADIPTLMDWWPKAYPDPVYRQWVMESWREKLEGAKRTGAEFVPMEVRICCKNGKYITVEASASPLNEAFSDIHLVTLFDVTERKRSEEEMKENAKRLLEINSDLIQQKRALDQHALVSITDVHGMITYANEKFCDISGYAVGELVGKTHRIINSGCHSPEFFSALWRDICAGMVWHGEICNRKKNGELYWVNSTIVPLMNADGKPTAYIAIRTDVTASRESELARRELEGQLLQMQKMEAIGTLAGGIAHDFNNILGIVIGNAEMLGTEATLTQKQRNCQARIITASDRAGDLVRQILNFSRKQDSIREIVQFDRLIADALDFLRASIPASTLMTEKFSAGDARVRVDVTQIHQVVMNLITNAWQALPGQQGLITVSTSVVDASGGMLAKGTALPTGRHVQLDVSDNGPGIPPELVGRIFEPFFTTKESGKGTGLGLAVVHGVVRRHGGAIVVRNNEGGGTTFRVLFPVVMDPISQSMVLHIQPPVGGSKRVLVVDDESALAELASVTLTDLGYQVTTCCSPRTALTMLSGTDPGFDVLLIDLTMPDMTGDQLVLAVHALHAELPIVLTTGFIDHAKESELARLNIASVLMKPWTMLSLSQAVHLALHKSAGGTP